MEVELIVISSLPTTETGSSAARYIPNRIYQKKIFNTESISLEECIDSKGKLNKRYSIIKSDNEYYKIKESYETLKNKYFKKLVILGLNAKRSNYTNL